jgi:hypothetical protein
VVACSVGAVVLLAAAVVTSRPDPAAVEAGAPFAAAANSCPLDLERWGQIRGEEPERDGAVYRQVDNDTTNPSFYMPQQEVTGGQQWRFGFDTTVSDSPDNDGESGVGSAQVRVEVDWYSTPGGDNSGYLGHVDGPWVGVAVNAGATHVSHAFTAPAGAVRANVLTDMRTDDIDNTWTGQSCNYQQIVAQQPTATTAPPATSSSTTTTTEPAAPPPSTPPTTAAPPAPGQVTAAGRYGWGDPIPEGSDEFDYGSEAYPAAPDRARWDLAGRGEECWPGHAGSGRRCEGNARVVGDLLRITGEANGDTGWIASTFGQEYGRWEARVRSEATGPDNGRQYHPLLILWPDSNQHPNDGEYDYLENGEPGAACAQAFIHYPHDDGVPVQQEFAERCDVDLTQWHNFAIEWTPDHIKGFVDGVEWFSFSGGENDVRRCIQCSPGMHQTIQLDNFYGDTMQPAVYEVDWARAYAL